MFYRFMAGIFHPFIHTGFGIEFKDQVMLAEGLAFSSHLRFWAGFA
jgi:hypothetical protein